MNIGSAIYQIRGIRQLSQGKLAELSRVNDGYISLIELNKRTPTLGVLKRIAHALGVNLTVIFLIAEREDPLLAPYVPLLYYHLLKGDSHVK